MTLFPDTPTAEATAGALQHSVGLLYRRIRQSRQTPGDLTLAEASALSQLRLGPTTAAQLAKAEQISPQSIGPIVAALLDKGLASRTPDPSDGRRQILRLSPAGEEMVAVKRNRRARQFTDALEHFTPEERSTLLAAMPLLERLAAEISA